jgi:type II secretory pathway component GspD/PulD (secretin)
LTNNEEFGVDWFAKYNNRFVGISRNNSIFGNNNPSIPVPGTSVAPGSSVAPIGSSVLDPANLINFSQIIQNVSNGTNIYVAAGNAFAAIVHLLESTNRFRVISRPTVFTSNNKKAIIASGRRFPFR